MFLLLWPHKPHSHDTGIDKRAEKEGQRLEVLVDKKENSMNSGYKKVQTLRVSDYVGRIEETKQTKKRGTSAATSKGQKRKHTSKTASESTKPKEKKKRVVKKKPTTVKAPTKAKAGSTKTKQAPKESSVSPQDPLKNPDGTFKGSCKHSGLLSLKKMNKTSVSYYTQSGQFLHCSFCRDCNTATLDLDPSVVDGTMIYYCDSANVAFKAARGDAVSTAAKKDLACRLVLCVPCFFKRVDVQEKEGGTKGRRGRGRH